VAENEVDRQWIVEPPVARGEISLHLAVGEGVQLTEEQENAVSALLRTLEAADPEVSGHAIPCPKQGSCGTLKCPNMSCGALKCGTFKDSLAAPSSAGNWGLMGTFGAPA